MSTVSDKTLTKSWRQGIMFVQVKEIILGFNIILTLFINDLSGYFCLYRT